MHAQLSDPRSGGNPRLTLPFHATGEGPLLGRLRKPNRSQIAARIA